MNAPFILTLVLLSAVAYALPFAAATALVEILAGPWRRAAGAHWTEQARLAFAPGAAVQLAPPLSHPAL